MVVLLKPDETGHERHHGIQARLGGILGAHAGLDVVFQDQGQLLLVRDLKFNSRLYCRPSMQ